MKYAIPFKDIRNKDIAIVGGKNASLGEMIHELGPLGVKIPDGFATTAEAFRLFLKDNNLIESLKKELEKLDTKSLKNLPEVGDACRALMLSGRIPEVVKQDVLLAYKILNHGQNLSFAVRSSATAEDLPTASFAGQHSSFLNVAGEENILKAIHNCYVSLFNDRAIKYRIDNGFDHMQVALSAGVQRMVRSDISSAGVAFTIDPESGFANVIYITSAWGLGENVVQGAVNPDEFYAFKPSIEKGIKSLFSRKLGEKENRMVYADGMESPIINIKTSPFEQHIFSLSDMEVEALAKWCLQIEKHYHLPMDIEWAKDGLTGELFIVQARPETIHGQDQKITTKEYKLLSKADPITKGKAVGRSIASGKVCIVHSVKDVGKVKEGDVIVADITNPDWNAMLRKAICIVTNKGGRTSHASIVARELGIHAVVGTGDATQKLKDGQMITVSCIEGDEGMVYDGKLDWSEKVIDLQKVPPTKTKPMFILADPSKAFRFSFYPNNGVGLLRMEFIISNEIRIHPMALVKFGELPESNDKKSISAITQQYPDKKKYFIEKLSESVAMVAAAFYPKDVIVRMSDFKSNEYAQLIGGGTFEPEEENPMIGFRGASRYYNERYKEGFGLECEAMRVIREEMGFTNVKLMIPFCRTVEEGKKVLETMKEFGLERGKNGLEVYVMAEIPSNVILAKEFAEIFDGFSIGSNDLTQLTLGIDRDSEIVSDIFDENNEAVKKVLSSVIQSAKKAKVKIGLCGQAPSDFPEYASFLVEEGIDSISFNPDAILKGIENIALAESKST
ncbi:phosphoenolpyruvate synthase [Aquiflexum sp. TKW24L]|uniref:phosphoenolpyruvate synthase n=1 Tax=Aquiflexum sp. TKW24L TaxID=2942212 RepID=UPI0020BF31E7|nr:phosphoenolpyruvate synthase [Aquiflexum sp. TKW24L]MCL6259052.1 phosphoenolpyruvate synthase [Aquiflexum sp. TKW24L]